MAGLSKIPSAGFQDNVKFRNLIINGGMDIAQRSTSESGVTTGGYYTIDRFRWTVNANDTVTLSQSTDTPSGQGFSNSFKVDVTTADTSIGADEYAFVRQSVEAQNCQYLNYGTSSAKTLTLSFWVKSSKTGTYCIDIDKLDNTRYNYVAEYTIDSASTWEKKTIIIAPDSNIQASGGAINNDNQRGLDVKFTLATGSNRQGTNETWNTSVVDGTSNQVNFLDSTSNEWYLTGVQLEAGEVASDFEFLPVDVNKDRCFRYYQLVAKADDGSMVICNGALYNSNHFYGVCTVGKPMRAEPSFTAPSGTNYYTILSEGIGYNLNSISNIENFSNDGGVLKCRIKADSVGMPTGNGAWFRFTSSANGQIFEADAEL